MAKLRFYYSAMNAGKSTALLQAAFNYHERGMKTLLFTPAIDTREKLGTIASRIGLHADAHPFDGTLNFFTYIEKLLNIPNHGVKCVMVDEAQFLTKQQVKQLTQVVDELNMPILAYGLRSDFMGEPFEGSQYLLIWAEDLIEIKTVCHCGSKAIMNLRIDGSGLAVWSGEQVEIGGNDRYVSLCRRHFWEGKSSH